MRYIHQEENSIGVALQQQNVLLGEQLFVLDLHQLQLVVYTVNMNKNVDLPLHNLDQKLPSCLCMLIIQLFKIWSHHDQLRYKYLYICSYGSIDYRRQDFIRILALSISELDMVNICLVLSCQDGKLVCQDQIYGNLPKFPITSYIDQQLQLDIATQI